MKNDLRFPWSAGVSLYGRVTPAAVATQALALTGTSIYTATDAEPYIYQQIGGSPDADVDLLVGRSREFLYGSEAEANGFFAGRLHNWDWVNADSLTRLQGLRNATLLLEQFNYVGAPASEEQLLAFPRGEDTVAPRGIRFACYLIADALISGRVPAQDLEQLQTKVETIGAIRTEFERSRGPMEHLINLIPSPEAWALLRPFLDIPTTFTVRRS